MIKKTTHPRDVKLELVFNADNHTYALDEKELVSVTTLIHSRFPKFDAEAISEAMSKGDSKAKAELLNAWEEARIEASERGNRVHAMAENLLVGNDNFAESLIINEKDRVYFNALRAAIPKLLKKYEVIGIEKIVFSPSQMVAGTIDLLLRDKQTGEYVVADWKTNKEIKTVGYRGLMGFRECDFLPDCNYSHYSLQLSAYKTLLLQEGYLPEGAQVRCLIFHLKHDDDQVRLHALKVKDLTEITKQLLAANITN